MTDATPPAPAVPGSGLMESGLVIKALSGFYTVYTENGNEVVCVLRGRLKQTRQETDLAAIGDRVSFERLPDGTGVIDTVAERTGALIRRGRSTRRRRYAERGLAHLEHDRGVVILANPDQAVFVFAAKNPSPNLRMLDRFLVAAEANHVPAVICANKIDLLDHPNHATDTFGLYAAIGYPVLYTSAATGAGVDTLRAQLTGKISALTGPSGVGKSSLLNAVKPGLGQAVSAISRATQKGRHTTVHAEMFPLDGGGWVADTPGIRALTLFDLTPEELDGYFVEIAPLVSQCEYRDCHHQAEPGCAVRQAVANGQVHPSRYDSYLRLRAGLHD